MDINDFILVLSLMWLMFFEYYLLASVLFNLILLFFIKDAIW